MSVESDDDRLALLSDFGIDVEIGGKTITAILDNLWRDANGIEVNVPVLTARTSDLSSTTRGQSVTIGDTSYTAEEFRSDELGITNIILQEV